MATVQHDLMSLNNSIGLCFLLWGGGDVLICSYTKRLSKCVCWVKKTLIQFQLNQCNYKVFSPTDRPIGRYILVDWCRCNMNVDKMTKMSTNVFSFIWMMSFLLECLEYIYIYLQNNIYRKILGGHSLMFLWCLRCNLLINTFFP